MNKFNRAALNRFSDTQNVQALRNMMLERFAQSKTACEYIMSGALNKHHGIFISHYEKQLTLSRDSRVYKGDSDTVAQTNCMNRQFIEAMSKFINEMVLRVDVRDALDITQTDTSSDGWTASTRNTNNTRTVLDDRNTGIIDDPMLAYTSGGNQQSFAMQTNKPFGATRDHYMNARRKEHTALSRETRARANAHLDKQRYASRGVQMRDDDAGDTGDRTHAQRSNVSIPTGNNMTAGFDPTNYESGTYANRFTGDADFNEYDITNELLSSDYIQRLNQPESDTSVLQSTHTYTRGGRPQIQKSCDPQNNVKFWTDGDGFADQSSPAEMNRLMRRRINRSFNFEPCYICAFCLTDDTDNCENNRMRDPTAPKGAIAPKGDTSGSQIPFWQRTVHSRHYERDVDESINGTEKGCHVRGYNMDELNCRLPQKVPCGKDTPPVRRGYNHVEGPSYRRTAAQKIRK